MSISRINKIHDDISRNILPFELPRYSEIPNIGLFLEQTTKYINEYLAPLGNVSLTGSMVSNYVKKKIIANPVKKQYDREQIAYLFFIAIAKTVLSLEDIQLLLELQQETYDCETAYEYFRAELSTILTDVFNASPLPDVHADKNPEEKALLHNMIITAAHKVYLDQYFTEMRSRLREGVPAE